MPVVPRHLGAHRASAVCARALFRPRRRGVGDRRRRSLLGRCLQHELGHLDGITMFDAATMARIEARCAMVLAAGARPGRPHRSAGALTMRVVFMGTPAFAATILDDLGEHHDVAAVYTRPDAVRGRGKRLEPSPVRPRPSAAACALLTPRTLRDEAAQRELALVRPDVICVAAYGAILPKEVLDIPRFGCLNVHASLLPRWRGAAPSSEPSWRATRRRACASCAWRAWTQAPCACAAPPSSTAKAPPSLPMSWPTWARTPCSPPRACRARRCRVDGAGRGAGHLRLEDREARAGPVAERRRCARGAQSAGVGAPHRRAPSSPGAASPCSKRTRPRTRRVASWRRASVREVRFAGKHLFLGAADGALEVGALARRQADHGRAFVRRGRRNQGRGLTWEEPHA